MDIVSEYGGVGRMQRIALSAGVCLAVLLYSSGPSKARADSISKADGSSDEIASPETIVHPRLADHTEIESRPSSDVIIDDLDVYFCIRSPCPGFSKSGPEGAWRSSVSSDTTHGGHAYWTYTTGAWVDDETNNAATWVAELPDDGEWEVCAYIPRVYTGRADTTRARYQVHNTISDESTEASASIPYVEVDQTRGPGWVSLGSYEFDWSEFGPWGYVTLSDVTPDWGTTSNRKTILFDAVKWTQGAPCSSTGSGPVDVDAYLPGRSDGAIVGVGEEVAHCYRIIPPTPVNIRYIYTDPDGPTVLASGRDDGRGACYVSTTMAPGGLRTIRIEAWNDARTSIVATDETSFFVREDEAPTAVPPPTSGPPPTVVPPPAPPPTPVPPTPEPTPITAWRAVIVPGYGNSIPFTEDENKKVHRQELRDLEERLNESGVPTITCFYDWTRSNDDSAETLRSCIEDPRSGFAPSSKRIALISWSNGGLVARALLQDDPPAGVELLVMIAPPNKGAVAAYPSWAGGRVSHLPFLLKLGSEIAYGSNADCSKLRGAKLEQCRYLFNRDRLPSLGQLVPVEERYLMVESGGSERMIPDSEVHRHDRNSWLLALNAEADRLRSAVSGDIVIVRGEGHKTIHMVRVNGDSPGDPNWRNGRFKSVSHNETGDGLIRVGRAGLLDFETLTYDANHSGLIALAERNVIRPRLGLPDLVVDSHTEFDSVNGILQSDEPMDGLWVVAATRLPFTMVDGRGRQAGRYAIGLSGSEIPGVRVHDTGEALHIVFDTMPDEDFTLRFVGDDVESSEVGVTFIRIADAEVVWRHSVGIKSGDRLEIPGVNPTRMPISTAHLPIALFGER